MAQRLLVAVPGLSKAIKSSLLSANKGEAFASVSPWLDLVARIFFMRKHLEIGCRPSSIIPLLSSKSPFFPRQVKCRHDLKVSAASLDIRPTALLC